MLALAASTPGVLGGPTAELTFRASGFRVPAREPAGEYEIVFRREPEGVGALARRGALAVGPGRDDLMGYLCDTESGKLYLDLNRNLDLTDDPEGVFKLDRSDWITRGSNIRIEVDRDGVAVPYVLDLTTYGSHWMSWTVVSGWVGNVRLGDRVWTFAVADNLDGVIDGDDVFVLLPPDDRDEPPGDDILADTIPAGSSLVVDGGFYGISFRFQGGADDSRLVAAWQELPKPGGAVRVEGKGIRRIVLGGPSAVDLRDPKSTTELPAGEYTIRSIVLQDREDGPWFESSPSRRFVVRDGETTVLDAGGPLEHRVKAVRSGQRLRLSYELRGRGGDEYRSPILASADAPRFSIMQRGRVIASGAFEYG